MRAAGVHSLDSSHLGHGTDTGPVVVLRDGGDRHRAYRRSCGVDWFPGASALCCGGNAFVGSHRRANVQERQGFSDTEFALLLPAGVNVCGHVCFHHAVDLGSRVHACWCVQLVMVTLMVATTCVYGHLANDKAAEQAELCLRQAVKVQHAIADKHSFQPGQLELLQEARDTLQLVASSTQVWRVRLARGGGITANLVQPHAWYYVCTGVPGSAPAACAWLCCELAAAAGLFHAWCVRDCSGGGLSGTAYVKGLACESCHRKGRPRLVGPSIVHCACDYEIIFHCICREPCSRETRVSALLAASASLASCHWCAGTSLGLGCRHVAAAGPRTALSAAAAIGAASAWRAFPRRCLG